ncbi:serine dehydratase beta chain, partial [Escherichia coli]|uniref:serine dehydratase beta chain n=1 Tax=Escherichia coli TaxID=562 RepID=UPI00207CE573
MRGRHYCKVFPLNFTVRNSDGLVLMRVVVIFKMGSGSSSLHTVGPMYAGKRFIDRLESSGLLTAPSH